MPTASYLIADMQAKLGDPSGNIFTSANLLNWLNEAQKEFCLENTPLRQVDATVIATGVNVFPIPSDKILWDGIFSRKQIGTKLKYLTYTQLNTQIAACPGAFGYDSDSCAELDGKLYVYPSYGTSAATAFCPFGATSTATTITVTSTSGWKAWGRFLTSSGEEVEYASIDGNNFYGCTRGVGGTTPASINKASKITQCDLWMVYRRYAKTMTAMTDVPEVPSVFHEGLEHYAMYLAYKQVGEMDKAKLVYGLWEEFVDRANYIASKEVLDSISIRDTETQLFNHLDGPR